jgi:hypothetical protein
LRLALLNSGLFQPNWYLAQNKDLRDQGVDPFDHFLRYGGFEGRWPNPMFDPGWYLQQNPDVAKEKMNPLVHYVFFGERENRNPSRYFDVEWYRNKYQSEIRADGALAHFLRHRHLNQHAPNPFFDPVYYVSTNKDLAFARADPLRHFLSNGWRENRNPCADFDVRFYAERHLLHDPRDPLTHYLEVGRAAGLLTRPEQETAHSVADEVRRFAGRSIEFEETEPNIIGSLERRARAFAFYLPQFHAIPENDYWWGKGFTEWTNVARATPRFVGHYQPRIPRDFGYYDLNDPSVMPRQVTAAKAAGLEGFCFYYYNFNGKRLLDRPIDDFLRRPELNISFCLMWANENWTRRWDGCEAEILMSQDYRDEDCEALVDDIARHFADPRYLRINGRPLLLLYRVDTIPEGAQTLAKWRGLFRSRHDEDPLVVMAQGFGNFDPTQYGFDGAVEFPPHKVTANLKWANSECTKLDRSFTGSILKYADIVRASLDEAVPSYPLIKTVMPSWDNDARRQGKGMSVIGSSPAVYETWLGKTVGFARQNPFYGEPLVFINAWNEWAEAAYLEPDVHFGGAYLNATARAIVGLTASAERRKLLLLADQAAPGPVQASLIEMAKTVRGQFGVEVRFLLRGEGAAEAYRSAAPTILAKEIDQIRKALEGVAVAGFNNVILNSPVAGLLLPLLKEQGMSSVALIDQPLGDSELAGAVSLAQRADQIVFGSADLRDAFVSAVRVVRARASILPSVSRAVDPGLVGASDEAEAQFAEPTKGWDDDRCFYLLERFEPDLKRVSVIIPNYNYGRYMVERLGSVFDQKYPPFEIIVLDDCSTDDSLGTLADITRVTKRRVRVVANTTNSGNVFAQWTKGVELARGGLVWIAEADDIADPQFLERLTAYFDDPATAFAFSDSRAIDAKGNLLGESYKNYYVESGSSALAANLFEDARRFAARHLSSRNLILNVSAVLWRRDRLLRSLAESRDELLNYKLAGDWRLYLSTCAGGGKVGYCAEPLNTHRRHEGGVTSRLNAERHLAEIERAHTYFNQIFGEDIACLRTQEKYRGELRLQFGLENAPAIAKTLA